MHIQLRITDPKGLETGDFFEKSYSGPEITIGSYNNDTVKLDHSKVDGCHVRIGYDWDTTQNTYRLQLTNIGGSKPVYLDNQALQSDQISFLSPTTTVRLGEYLLFARLLENSSLSSVAPNSLTLEKFNPNSFTLEDSLTAATPQTAPDKRVPGNINTPPVPAQQQEPAHGNTRRQSDTTNVVSLVPATTQQVLFEGVVGTDDITDLHFDAFRLCTLRGKLTRRGSPLPQLEIDAGDLGKTVTNETGEFCFERVVEGAPFSLKLQHEGYRVDNPELLSGKVGEETYVAITLSRLTRVCGRLLHNGTPLAGVTLSAGEFGQCISDQDGFYQFDGIPEETRLSITASNLEYQFRKQAQAQQQPATEKTAPSGNTSKSLASDTSADPVSETVTAEPLKNAAAEAALEDSLAVLVGGRSSVG